MKTLREQIWQKYKNPNCNFNGMKGLIDKIRQFEVRDQDIYVLSFPKCGTTWCQEMVWLIANDLNFEGAKEAIHHRFVHIELSGLQGHMCGPKVIQTPYLTDSLKFTRNARNPRFIKCHLQNENLPKQLTSGETNSKQFCIVTDSPFGNYWDHVLYFWERRNNKNILFIKYEDMSLNIRTVIRKVAEFLNKILTEEQELKLAHWLDFKSMKMNPSCYIRFNKEDLYGQSGFIRNGKVGDYINFMSPDTVSKIDCWSQEKLKNTDYEYTY
ncbi:hypothetical protein RI129_001682 [Pyrocoelia pectoralis]|uniref:Sulfotransferase domain-containing protein n=1 Tax=Pyrocoelia pectoralis TaxID=417401 RepID=A0AAN7VXV3_9COLE